MTDATGMSAYPAGFLEHLYRLDRTEKDAVVGRYISDLHGLLWDIVRQVKPHASGALPDYRSTLVSDVAALAERLKEEVDQHCESNRKLDRVCEQRDQLQEKLKASEELRAKGLLNRIEMEGAFYEERDQLKADLKACEDLVERHKIVNDMHLKNIENQSKVIEGLHTDLQTARAEEDYERAYKETAKAGWQTTLDHNSRLKAALVGFMKLAEVNGTIPRIYVEQGQAALTETPSDGLAERLAKAEAELARMKADPEILTRHQANEAQRALEAGQEKKGE